MQAVRRVVVFAALLAATGCDVDRITVGGHPGVVVTDRWTPWLVTDHSVYTLRYTAQTVEVDIRFRFENRSRHAVAIPRCTHPYRPALDKLIGGEWVEVLSPRDLCWNEPVVVGPNRSQYFAFRVQAWRPHMGLEPRFQTNHIPGTYRLRWDIYEYDAFGQFRIGAPLPIEHRVSNEFRLIH
jgi:hypothetical protein